VSDKVVSIEDFKVKQPEWVFQCSCSGQLFYLNHDGTIECRSCKMIRQSIEWTYRQGMEPKS